MKAPSASVGDPIETKPKVKAYTGIVLLETFLQFCKFVQSKVSRHKSIKKFAILLTAVTLAAAMFFSTPSAKFFAVTYGWLVRKCIVYFADLTK